VVWILVFFQVCSRKPGRTSSKSLQFYSCEICWSERWIWPRLWFWKTIQI